MLGLGRKGTNQLAVASAKAGRHYWLKICAPRFKRCVKLKGYSIVKVNLEGYRGRST